MTYSQAKVLVQRSVVSKDGVETNGWTDGRTEATTLPVALIRLVITVWPLTLSHITIPLQYHVINSGY